MVEKQNMIAMKVTGLTIDPFTNMPIIILKDLEEKLALPIWIGLIEASSIATELEKLQLARPMTHDLIRTILKEFKGNVEKVEIVDLIDNTFYASIYFQQEGRSVILDSRPSDAIAIALRMNAPIYVDQKVMDKSRRIDLSKVSEEGAPQAQKWADVLENLSPEDFGKYKM